MQPRHSLSVFLTAIAEIDTLEGSNTVVSRSSNDTICSYTFKNLKAKIEIKYSKNYYFFWFIIKFIAWHHLGYWTTNKIITTLKRNHYTKFSFHFHCIEYWIGEFVKFPVTYVSGLYIVTWCSKQAEDKCFPFLISKGEPSLIFLLLQFFFFISDLKPGLVI